QPYQLQRIIDNTNPLYLRLGNPGLTYSSLHRVNFNINLYNQKSSFNINSNGNFNAILNNISNSTVFDKSSGVQTTMPVNMDGAYNGYARLYANKSLKLFHNHNGLYASVSYNVNRQVSLLDYQENTSINTGINFSGGTTVEVKEFADISVGYRYNIQQNTYS